MLTNEQKERKRITKKIWSIKNRDEIKAYNKERRFKRKIIVFNYYSNNDIKCSCCGIRDHRCLTIDHINGKGRKHIKELNIRAGDRLYDWLIQNNFPEGFQVLCYNCNCAKRTGSKCPIEH